jgi:ubiquinone/menaquinone biosynthesis C-methylase UbiE
MRRNIIHWLCLLAAMVTLDAGRIAQAQEESIHPDINARFEDADVEVWLTRFEREGRDVYQHRDEVVAAVGLEPGMDVADIGTGTGFFTMLFAREVGPNGTVYAIDITRNFVEYVTETADELGLDNVKGIVNPIDSTNLEENSIDVAFMAHTYHHFEYPFKMLESIADALRPDGVVVLVDAERVEGVSPKFVLGMVRAGKGTFTDEFRNAGFELIDDVPFTEKDYILKFKLRQ